MWKKLNKQLNKLNSNKEHKDYKAWLRAKNYMIKFEKKVVLKKLKPRSALVERVLI